MSDVSGSRFLRMAGSDDFQNRLNRSAQPTGTQESSVTGDFTFDSSSKPATGSNDYSMMIESPDQSKPSSIQGPGSFGNQVMADKTNRPTAPKPGGGFGQQVDREVYLEDNDIAQGSGSDSFVMKYAQMNKDLQGGDAGDGMSIANRYIQNAAKTNPINIQALDKHIRTSPLYHGAKSELEGLKTFGDMYRYGREQLPDFKLPSPMEAVEKPDFEGMYDKSRDDIDSIDI